MAFDFVGLTVEFCGKELDEYAIIESVNEATFTEAQGSSRYKGTDREKG